MQCAIFCTMVGHHWFWIRYVRYNKEKKSQAHASSWCVIPTLFLQALLLSQRKLMRIPQVHHFKWRPFSSCGLSPVVHDNILSMLRKVDHSNLLRHVEWEDVEADMKLIFSEAVAHVRRFFFASAIAESRSCVDISSVNLQITPR